ncbi:MAG: CYTH domain-containing protein [Ruminococcus sp.]|nr:CYTH domain-containing protein [Ruminococcus sp.]
MDKPLEIEYKYLIRYPDVKVLEAQPGYRVEEMRQLYLELPTGFDSNGKYCRIRSSKTTEGIRFIKTFKESLSDMTRIEIEEEISQEEFTELSKFIREGYAPISKHRHSFKLFGFTYEVDIFPFWQDRAYLEIEVDSEETKPPIPDFLSIIKDVTSDIRYRNTSLSQRVITEDMDNLT